MTEMLELSDKDFKATVVKMLQQLMMNILEAIEKIDSHSKEIKSSSKDIDAITNNHMEILELKNTITKIKTQ